jgi:hypothetical protein
MAAEPPSPPTMKSHYEPLGKIYLGEKELAASPGYKMPWAFKGLRTPALKYSIALMVSALVVAWIVMMLGAKRLHEARKLGEWKQQECGQEYMESETARYEMSKVYESHVRRYIYVALAMFMSLSLLSVALMAIFASESFVLVFFNEKAKLKGVSDSVFSKPDKMVGVTIVVATAVLLWQTSEISKIWADRMSEKSYAQATTVAAATEEINEKRMPALIQTSVISAVAMAAIVFVMYNKIFRPPVAFPTGLLTSVPDAIPMPYLIVVIFFFLIGLGLAMGLVKSYGMLNAYFSEYTAKTGEINASLKGVVNDSTMAQQMSDYLLNNIRRIYPKAELNAPNVLSTRYESEYYGYAMHEEGTELKFLNTSRITLVRAQGMIESLKDNLGILVLNNDIREAYKKLLDKAFVKVATSSALLSDKPDVSVGALQLAIAEAFKQVNGAQIPMPLNDALRFDMYQRLKADAGDDIKLSSLRETIDKFVRDRAQMKPNMGHSEIMSTINAELFAKLFPTLKGADLDEARISREDTKRDSIIEWFKCSASVNNGLCDVILLESLGTYMSTLAKDVSDRLMLADKTQGTIRDGMSTLRQNSLSGKADEFIGMVYIWSLIIAVLFAYLGFHLLYRRNPEWITIGSVVLILGLVLALSFYGWFMGQAM